MNTAAAAAVGHRAGLGYLVEICMPRKDSQHVSSRQDYRGVSPALQGMYVCMHASPRFRT